MQEDMSQTHVEKDETQSNAEVAGQGVAAPEMSPPKRGATDPKSVDPPVARPQPIQDDGTHSAPQDGHFHQLPHGKITSDVLQEGDISPLELQLQHARKDAGGLVQLQEQEDAHFQKHGEFHPGGEAQGLKLSSGSSGETGEPVFELLGDMHNLYSDQMQVFESDVFAKMTSLEEDLNLKLQLILDAMKSQQQNNQGGSGNS